MTSDFILSEGGVVFVAPLQHVVDTTLTWFHRP